MNDILKFIEKPYSLRINLYFRPENLNAKVWHRNRTI